MEKTYSTTLLYRGENNSYTLETVSTPLQPGHPFSLKGYTNILLCGGFSQLTPETPFPLSPTLQLNSDLTTWNEAKLESLALAELERNNTVNFRSYTVEVDKRVGVLAENAAQLTAFIDTYDGVLDITPILLKGVHPEYPTVTEMDIQGNGPYIISLTIKQPIDKLKCTYCGDCGISCPESCLSETLFLDYAKCSYCKECEKVCPTKALDIYGVEKHTLEIPAILILDGTTTDIHGAGNAIYSEKQLPALFKNLFPYQIEEVVCHSNTGCQYCGRLNSGCNLCLNSCAFNAISQSESGINIDPHVCRECGNCLANCPTGALQYARFTDKAFIKYFKDISFSDGDSIILGAEESLHKLWWKHRGERYEHQFFLEFPKVESLSLFHLLFLFSRGAGRIVILATKENQEEFHVQVAMANTILNSLFAFDDFVVISTSEIGPDYLHRQQHHPLQKFYGDLSFENRRAKIASVLLFLIRASNTTISLQQGELQGFGVIGCDTKRCTHCLACLNECSMNALSSDEQQLHLIFNAGKCVACGVCVKICPENALQFTPAFTIDEHFFNDKMLAQAEPAACKQCGKVFGTRKSLEKVMQILSHHHDVDDAHLEYCDECKVARIFETEEI